MNKSQSIVIVVLVICIINDSINGFSVGRKERHGYLSNRIQSNGFNMKAAMKNLSNGYKYVSKYFSNDARTLPSTTSDISDCTDCFLGMQVSAREAYVEFVLKVSEWFGWFLAVSLFPDPELLENDKKK